MLPTGVALVACELATSLSNFSCTPLLCLDFAPETELPVLARGPGHEFEARAHAAAPFSHAKVHVKIEFCLSSIS